MVLMKTFISKKAYDVKCVLKFVPKACSKLKSMNKACPSCDGCCANVDLKIVQESQE